MLYHNPKIIFIHVSKTGGSSVSKHLRHYADVNLRPKPQLKDRDPRFNNHTPLQEIVDAGIDIGEYRNLTVCRNTW